MKKRFLLFVLLFVCLFALCAHAVSIRFEGEDEAKLGGYMVVGESYKLYVDGYDSPDTVTFYILSRFLHETQIRISCTAFVQGIP